MTRQEKVLEKKRGRPAIGKGVQINTQLRPDQAKALDRWIASQPKPRPTRSEAARLAIVDWLTGLGLLKHRDDPEGAN